MDGDTMFCGQVSSVYLFSEALAPQQVAALHWLGPAYKVFDVIVLKWSLVKKLVLKACIDHLIL